MSRTVSTQILAIFLPRGWEPLKEAVRQAAAKETNKETNTVSGFVRMAVAKEIGFKIVGKESANAEYDT